MRSLQRQREIYLNGLAGIRPVTPVSYQELEDTAKHRLSPAAFAYLAGGAGQESTIRANRLALDQVQIHPHVLGGVQEARMFLQWRAHTLPAPFMLAPIGVLELAHPDGDLAVARAAATLGIPMIISSQASFPMEAIATELKNTPRLFQLYYSKSQDLAKSFVRRAEKIHCSAIIVTLDTTLLGWRNRDLSMGYNPFLLGKGIAQYTSDPVFNSLPDPSTDGTTKPPVTLPLFLNRLQIGKSMRAIRKFIHVFNNPGLTWEDIARLRDWTTLPIYLKGVLRKDDANRAADTGLDGIIVSNHGGRQVDGTVASAEALFHILSAVQGRLEVWMDSGIRSGSDAFKCLAMGATGVLIGRPYAMALACQGEQGVRDCLQNIMAELELNMALSGCRDLTTITPDLISHPWKTT